mmetsp:Transcript_17512/g.35648  ORF Transcript_17512/g.35648 Transcript_17512/m.35648 type:complete len:272 (+) Transcript_17512:73-888(+)
MIRAFLATIAALLLPFSTNSFATPSSQTIISLSSKHTATSSVLSATLLQPETISSLIHSTSSLLLNDEAISTISPAVEAARQKFWFYFFAGSGAGGIGISQLPAIFRDASSARSSAGTGHSLGGEALNAGPLLSLYYDNIISVKDVIQAIEKAPNAEFITKRSQSVNYLASKGYIDRRDFIREMVEGKKCNPLASCAVYDAISAGKGDLVSPDVYDEKLAVYRGEGGVGTKFVGDLNGFLAVKVGAFLALVFCLIIDFGFIAKAGIEGFLS